MIKITYSRQGSRHCLTVRGHAGYGEQGKDIVCAGVSALTQALLGWLGDNRHRCRLLCGPVAQPGFLHIGCAGGKETAAVFSMTAAGCGQLAEAYPDHVEYRYSCHGR